MTHSMHATLVLALLALPLVLAGCSDGEPSSLVSDTATETEEEWVSTTPKEVIEELGYDPNRPPPPPLPASRYPDPPNWGPPAKLDPASVPNPYVNVGIGVSIERPESFVWLPESSMPDFQQYTERIPILEFDPQDYADPIQQPLISMASKPDPQWGRDVVALLFARPIAADLVAVADYFTEGHRIIPHILARRGLVYPGFEVVEAPVFEEVDGKDGATTRARYDVPDENGNLLPTTEAVWLTRIGRYLIFLNIIYPENADAQTLEQVRAIADSLRIDV